MSGACTARSGWTCAPLASASLKCYRHTKHVCFPTDFAETSSRRPPLRLPERSPSSHNGHAKAQGLRIAQLQGEPTHASKGNVMMPMKRERDKNQIFWHVEMTDQHRIRNMLFLPAMTFDMPTSVVGWGASMLKSEDVDASSTMNVTYEPDIIDVGWRRRCR